MLDGQSVVGLLVCQRPMTTYLGKEIQRARKKEAKNGRRRQRSRSATPHILHSAWMASSPPPLLGDTAMNAGRRGIQQCHNKRVRERDTRTEKLARRYGARAIDAGIQRQRVPRFFASPSPPPDHSHDDLLVACFSSPSTSGCGTSFVAFIRLMLVVARRPCAWAGESVCVFRAGPAPTTAQGSVEVQQVEQAHYTTTLAFSACA